MLMKIAFGSLLSAAVLIGVSQGDDNNHEYSDGEAVILWVNTVGPYNNPQEAYPYYSLPFCKPQHGISTSKRPSGIGEILEGYELRNSGFKMHFGENVDREDVCETILTVSSVAEFESAIDRQYWYELVLDDLPMWGMVGESLRDEKLYKMERHIFTHRSLNIEFNGKRIIEVNLTSENPVPINAGTKLQFTYSVRWIPTEKSFESRFNRYLEYDFFEHKIHWFSVFNSFMMVVFLCGLVALILIRTLRNDFARYAKEDQVDVEGIQMIGEDTGWKQIHGDVFRAPDHLVIFSAFLGTGWQLAFLVLGVLLYAIAGPYLHGNMYEDRGEMVSTIIVCYAISSIAAGFVSGSFYRQFFSTTRSETGSQWQKVMICTIALFPGFILAINLILNWISMYYSSLSAVPFSVALKIIAIWSFVSLPLGMVGTILGRHLTSKYEPPCRINSIPRPIPYVSWYCQPITVVLAAGILPFGSIFIEMYFIFTAFWSYKFYYIYGFMFLMFVILTLVTISTTIVAIYITLNAENHRWHWISFAAAASSSLYVFVYSIFYFFYKTQMSGLLQIAYYFGYMLLFCSGLGIMCGTLGVWGAGAFVHKIYRNVKID